MSFQSLNKEELADVAEFFTKDVKAADDEKGPSKAELLAALASDEDGSDPVSWDDYKNIYLSAKESGQDKSPEVIAAEKAAEEEAAKAEEAAKQAAADEAALAEEESAKPVDDEEEDEEVETAIVKFEGKNPTLQVVGYTFSKSHPFVPVPVEIAEYLISNDRRFRLALPSEVKDFYN